MGTIKKVFYAVGNVLGTFFGGDNDVMSEEAKRIFSNDLDKKKFIDAVERMKTSHSHRETIKLSTNEEITLVS